MQKLNILSTNYNNKDDSYGPSEIIINQSDKSSMVLAHIQVPPTSYVGLIWHSTAAATAGWRNIEGMFHRYNRDPRTCGIFIPAWGSNWGSSGFSRNQNNCSSSLFKYIYMW